MLPAAKIRTPKASNASRTPRTRSRWGTDAACSDRARRRRPDRGSPEDPLRAGSQCHKTGNQHEHGEPAAPLKLGEQAKMGGPELVRQARHGRRQRGHMLLKTNDALGQQPRGCGRCFGWHNGSRLLLLAQPSAHDGILQQLQQLLHLPRRRLRRRSGLGSCRRDACQHPEQEDQTPQRTFRHPAHGFPFSLNQDRRDGIKESADVAALSALPPGPSAGRSTYRHSWANRRSGLLPRRSRGGPPLRCPTSP